MILFGGMTLHQHLSMKDKRRKYFLAWMIKLYIIYDCMMFYAFEGHYRTEYKVRADLANMEPPIESVFLSQHLDTPDHTLLHRQIGNGVEPVKIHHAGQNPKFARELFGYEMILRKDRWVVLCSGFVDELIRGVQRPQYITMHLDKCDTDIAWGYQCSYTCVEAISNVKAEDG